MMNPVVGLGLTQVKLQSVHGLQGVSLLIDEDEEQLVLYAVQLAFDTGSGSSLSWLSFPC